MVKKRQLVDVDGRELALSNLEKVYFPESGFTKGQVIGFYSAIAATILPHLHNRPLTLKRYPEGINGEHFYEKNAPAHTPEWVERCTVARSEGGGDIRYILCNDRATLLWATNLGDIEKHVLLGRAPQVERPTSVVFDLDPGEGATLIDCCEVALHLKEVFDALKLQSFAKVSGSKGIHLTVPLNSAVTYEVTQPFAKTMAELVQQQMPDRVVSEMAKTLRKGKVMIDWSQNSDFKTTVCVYAIRAKHGEPFVSMPVRWEELSKAAKKGDEKALFFTAAAAVKRIQRLGDLHAPVLTLKQALPPAFTAALAAGPKPKLSRWPRNQGWIKDKSLREYADKRDHSQTPEPAAEPNKKGAAKKGALSFVIQKHEASHLHYDWRLEMSGVLRSWAVPKGPPTVPRQARLAMHVEDHPMEYASFEGTIPAGNYGAGTVMVWDQGEYEDITGNPAAAFHQGKMHLIMRGKKLKGEWILLKDRRAEEDSNRWLLIKAGTALKLSAKADDTSAISGRSMRKIAKDNDAQWHSTTPAEKHAKKPPSSHRIVKPAFVEAMQCQPVVELPEGDDWTYEIKFDGFRCLAIKLGKKVQLWSRNQKSFTARYPEVVAALSALPGDFAMDGELVALDAEGRPSFNLMQNSGREATAVHFYAFDLINYEGEELLREPIEKRRELLNGLLSQASEPLRLSPLLDASTETILAAVQELGLEGVVGKRLGSVYEPGERSGAWVKRRLNLEQEFVIGGYVPGTHGFDSLLVGVYEGRKLQYSAKVRAGFVPKVRAEIFPALKKLTANKCPFANLPEVKGSSRWGEPLTAEKMEECRWVKPKLVCQIAFVEWTEGNRLRHCTYVGMRDDKKAAGVVRET